MQSNQQTVQTPYKAELEVFLSPEQAQLLHKHIQETMVFKFATVFLQKIEQSMVAFNEHNNAVKKKFEASKTDTQQGAETEEKAEAPTAETEPQEESSEEVTEDVD